MGCCVRARERRNFDQIEEEIFTGLCRQNGRREIYEKLIQRAPGQESLDGILLRGIHIAGLGGATSGWRGRMRLCRACRHRRRTSVCLLATLYLAFGSIITVLRLLRCFRGRRRLLLVRSIYETAALFDILCSETRSRALVSISLNIASIVRG